MKKSIKTYDIPMYFGSLTVIQGKSRSWVEKTYDFERGSLFTFSACAFNYTDKEGMTNYVMVFFEKTEPSIIAHEAVHTVNAIFKDRHIKLDLYNDEPQAYLLGWVVGMCHKTLKLK